VIKIFKPATLKERQIYYREEWKPVEIPDFIKNSVEKREFGFDHVGRGPSDRYKVFRSLDVLRRFLRHKSPFAAYCSVAFYDKPWKRGEWIKSELVFDVDAKDIPVRSCSCDNVCEICLDEAKSIVGGLVDTLKGDLGLEDVHIVYSGRGYHIRVLDEVVMKMGSDVRSQILKYILGTDVPKNTYQADGFSYNVEHFSIPFGYPQVFTERAKYTILHLTENIKIEDISKQHIKKIIRNRELVKNGQWGQFRTKIGPINYKRFIKAVAELNMGLVDAKVTIDLKRILRLPSSLHSMVSMKCVEVGNIESFDPFKEAVPRFVYERD